MCGDENNKAYNIDMNIYSIKKYKNRKEHVQRGRIYKRALIP